MRTRGGVIPKPRVRRRKKQGKSGASHLAIVEPPTKRDRTDWKQSIRDLFRK